MAGSVPVAATIPAPSRRPGSGTWGDVYGGLSFPTTAALGTSASGKLIAAASADRAPITVNGIGPGFLAQPAGVLAVLVAALLVWSYLDKG